MNTLRIVLWLAIGLGFAESAAGQGKNLGVNPPVPKRDDGSVDVPTKKKEVKKDIVIECQGRAFFDNDNHIVIFQEDVIVHHPSFLIHCEELEVQLLGDVTTALGAGGSDTPPAAGATEAKKPEEQIDELIARGLDRIVTLKKQSVKGLVLAKAGEANYNGKTKDNLLRDWPVVNRASDGASVQATEKGTIITIKESGDFEVLGPHIFEKGGKAKRKTTGK